VWISWRAEQDAKTAPVTLEAPAGQTWTFGTFVQKGEA
jgi:hypothetical protein